MKRTISLLKLRIPLFIFLICYFIFALLTYKQYGITFDERDVYLRGKLLYIKVRGNDQTLQKDFVIPRGSNEMIYYNNTYPAFLYQLNSGESFERYHLLNFIFVSLIFIALYEVLLSETKNIYYALLGPIFLVFTPRFFGDIPSNPKDIPFAVLYFLSLSLIFLSQEWNDKARILILGISFGLTQSARLVGYTIYPVFLIFSLLSIFNQKNIRYKKKILVDMFFETFLILCIGLLIHVFSVPYLGADPINHFIDLIKMTSNNGWDKSILFFGNLFLPKQLPWLYLPVWFLITLPCVIIPLIPIGIVKGHKERLVQLLLISLGVNILMFILIKPVIYDGIRHFLYFLPQLILLSVTGLIYLLKKHKRVGLFFGIIVIANFILIAMSYVRLHPFEYVYFNELIGGVRGASSLFETDYWGAANREATLWIRDNIANKSSQAVTINVCGTSYSASYHFSNKMRLADNKKGADYVICWDRFQDNRGVNGKIIYQVKRDGVSLVNVYKINHD